MCIFVSGYDIFKRVYLMNYYLHVNILCNFEIVSGIAHCALYLSSIEEITLFHWGRATHICVVKLTIIGSDNGLSPGRRQAIIWTNDWILSIGTLGTNFNDILIGIQTFSFQKMEFEKSSAKWRPFCLGLNVLNIIDDYELSTARPWWKLDLLTHNGNHGSVLTQF